jgi:putative membrane protein
MRWKLFLALALGLAVLAFVLLRFDLGAVTAALERTGWGGFAIIVLAGLAAEVVLALGLYPLLTETPPLSVIVAARQLRDSTGDVLPITQLGGVAFGARALVLAGMKAIPATAGVTADLTTETFAQGLYVLVGVLASLSLLHADAHLSPYVGAMLGGALFLSAGSIGFAIVQMAGGRWIDRLTARLLPRAPVGDRAFHDAIHAIYRRRGRVALSILLQFAGWVASGLWLWVMLAVMGYPDAPWAAIAIQALVEGLRSATVFVPVALGVQEIGYAMLAPVFGFSPEIGLAMSLLRRARDVVVAVPVLLAWQVIEGRRAAKR